jgi:pilus assembly protein FimV
MQNLTNSKKLALAAVISIAILTPKSAYSLGIGDIRLQSGFNQNLKGEIELITSANEEINNLYIGIASPEKFDEAGVPWSYFLKKIKFKPVKRPDGSIFIELSSNEVLKELFLNFVLEVSWNKNNFLNREVMLLVDPSPSYNLATASLKYKKKSPDNKSAFLKSAANENAVSQNPDQYGPIKNSDFIWKIAKKTHYPDVSIEQMIIALFKANPDAFYANNINALTVKEMLTIPEKQLALEMSRKEALEVVRQQNTEWKQRNVIEKPSPSESIVNTVDIEKITSQIISEPFDLHITKKTAPFSNKKIAINNTQAIKEKYPNNQEETKENPSTAISSAEGVALLARLNKLEEKLDLLISKDKQSQSTLPVAELQSNATTTLATSATPQVSSSEAVALLNRQNELEQKLKTMEKMSVSDKVQQTPVLPATSLEKTTTSSKAVETEKLASINTLLNTISQERQTTSPLLLALYGGIGGAIFLSCLGFFWWLNKKKHEEVERDKSSKYSYPGLPISAIEQVLPRDEGGFLAQHADAFDSDETDEMDPIIETDIYLSHGLYEKAEFLMREILKDHPEKNQYHLKLLEVFLHSKNKMAFDEHVAKLTNTEVVNTPEFLEKVAKMEAMLHSKAIFDLSKLDNTVANENNAASYKQSTENGDVENKASFEVAFDTDEIAQQAMETQNNDVEITDNTQSESKLIDDQEIADNTIAFDLSKTAVEPVTILNTEFADDKEEDIELIADDNLEADDHLVAFDVFDFDANFDPNNTDTHENSKNSNGEPIKNHEFAFDAPDFDEEPLEETELIVIESSTRTENKEALVNNTIEFDLSGFNIESPNDKN